MKIIDSADVKGKKVLVRVDYNVPIKDGKILDDTRIRASLKTINYLLDKNAKVILFSHLGRIKSEEDKKTNSLDLIAVHLSSLVNHPVYFINETRGSTLESCVDNLLDGEILLMENTRFEDYPKSLESSCDETLSKYWASLADIYVLDAFATAHRCHASTYGVSKYIPSYSGFLVSDEVNKLDEALNNKNKVLILGGAKVDDKIGVINNLVKSSSKILIGGAMCFTFLKANDINVGNSIVSEENIEYAKDVLEKYKDKIVLPIDVVTQNGIKDINQLNKDDIGYDIGPKTIKLFESYLNSELVLWNGPLGMYEEKSYENGTKNIMKYLESNNIKTILAGGDVVSAGSYFKVKLYYFSTGGGSTLEYLEGKKFKTLERLNG